MLNGRKCYITNGGRAIWTVIFATVDPSPGRAGHRAFVVEKGTPGFEVGKIEEKMGLRANETAELVLEDCRVPEDNLLGGEEAYRSKEGFMTAMKTFDTTRPLVGAMAVGIGRAAYEYARDFVKDELHARPARPPLRRHRRAPRPHRPAASTRRACSCGARRPSPTTASRTPRRRAWPRRRPVRRPSRRASTSIEICGAHGSLATEHALLEKWFRDIKVYDIFEGTGNIQRVVISKRLIPSIKGF